MAKCIILKFIAFRWRHFKVNIYCAHHYPVTQHGHIHSPRSLHPDTSPEKPDRDSKRNSIKCPRSPMNIGTDSQKPSRWKRLTHQTSLLWRSTETSGSTCKGPMVQQSKGLGPAKLEVSLVLRWIKIHAAENRWRYTYLQTPEWEVRKELRPWGRRFRRRNCDDVGCHILRRKLVHIQGNLNAARYRDEVLTPHMLPAMNLRRDVFQHNNARQHNARATVDFLANQNVTVLPWPFKSLDLKPIEHLWMTWIDACAIVNQRLQQAFEQEWGSIP